MQNQHLRKESSRPSFVRDDRLRIDDHLTTLHQYASTSADAVLVQRRVIERIESIMMYRDARAADIGRLAAELCKARADLHRLRHHAASDAIAARQYAQTTCTAKPAIPVTDIGSAAIAHERHAAWTAGRCYLLGD